METEELAASILYNGLQTIDKEQLDKEHIQAVIVIKFSLYTDGISMLSFSDSSLANYKRIVIDEEFNLDVLKNRMSQLERKISQSSLIDDANIMFKTKDNLDNEIKVTYADAVAFLYSCIKQLERKQTFRAELNELNKMIKERDSLKTRKERREELDKRITEISSQLKVK